MSIRNFAVISFICGSRLMEYLKRFQPEDNANLIAGMLMRVVAMEHSVVHEGIFLKTIGSLYRKSDNQMLAKIITVKEKTTV